MDFDYRIYPTTGSYITSTYICCHSCNYIGWNSVTCQGCRRAFIQTPHRNPIQDIVVGFNVSRNIFELLNLRDDELSPTFVPETTVPSANLPVFPAKKTFIYSPRVFLDIRDPTMLRRDKHKMPSLPKMLNCKIRARLHDQKLWITERLRYYRNLFGLPPCSNLQAEYRKLFRPRLNSVDNSMFKYYPPLSPPYNPNEALFDVFTPKTPPYTNPESSSPVEVTKLQRPATSILASSSRFATEFNRRGGPTSPQPSTSRQGGELGARLGSISGQDASPRFSTMLNTISRNSSQPSTSSLNSKFGQHLNFAQNIVSNPAQLSTCEKRSRAPTFDNILSHLYEDPAHYQNPTEVITHLIQRSTSYLPRPNELASEVRRIDRPTSPQPSTSRQETGCSSYSGLVNPPGPFGQHLSIDPYGFSQPHSSMLDTSQPSFSRPTDEFGQFIGRPSPVSSQLSNSSLNVNFGKLFTSVSASEKRPRSPSLYNMFSDLDEGGGNPFMSRVRYQNFTEILTNLCQPSNDDLYQPNSSGLFQSLSTIHPRSSMVEVTPELLLQNSHFVRPRTPPSPKPPTSSLNAIFSNLLNRPQNQSHSENATEVSTCDKRPRSPTFDYIISDLEANNPFMPRARLLDPTQTIMNLLQQPTYIPGTNEQPYCSKPDAQFEPPQNFTELSTNPVMPVEIVNIEKHSSNHIGGFLALCRLCQHVGRDHEICEKCQTPKHFGHGMMRIPSQTEATTSIAVILPSKLHYKNAIISHRKMRHIAGCHYEGYDADVCQRCRKIVQVPPYKIPYYKKQLNADIDILDYNELLAIVPENGFSEPDESDSDTSILTSPESDSGCSIDETGAKTLNIGGFLAQCPRCFLRGFNFARCFRCGFNFERTPCSSTEMLPLSITIPPMEEFEIPDGDNNSLIISCNEVIIPVQLAWM